MEFVEFVARIVGAIIMAMVLIYLKFDYQCWQFWVGAIGFQILISIPFAIARHNNQ